MSDDKIWNRISNIVLSGAVAGLLVVSYLNLSQSARLPLPEKTPASPTATQQAQLAPSPSQTMPTQKNQGQIAPGAVAATGEQRIIDLYKENSSSVVNVTTRSFQYNSFMELVPQEGAGSGFVIDNQGHVVTNFHVVQGGQRFYVSFGNVEHSYPAKLVGFDQRNDLAVLKAEVPPHMLKPVKFGDSDHLQVGQTTVAIGNPFGLGQTMTTGVVSSLNRDLQAENGHVMSGLIQTDAAINRGNSGGPLFDSQGRVIGVNTLIYSPSGGSVGIGFAIPVNRVKRFVPDLIKYGKARYPWLGVSVLALSPRLSQIFKLPVNQGLMVLRTYPGGSAASAGISGGDRRVVVGNYEIYLGGDVILAVDGVKMHTEQDLSNYLESNKKVGEHVKITLLRGGKGQPVTVDVPLTAVRN